MRITSAGNVGIATSSPRALLDVSTGTIQNSTAVVIGPTSGTATIGNAIKLGFALQNTGGGGTGNTFAAGIGGIQDTSGGNTGALGFYTQSGAGDGTPERMRITSTGDICIGTTTASSSKLTVNQTTVGERGIAINTPASYASGVFRSISAATASTGWYHLYASSSSDATVNCIIYGNGNIQNANNSYGSLSDIKLKENIVDATPKLDKLMQVKVRNYNLKGDYEQHKQIGVIAQELETVFPGLIEETQDRGENDEILETTTKSVKYSVFIPMLIKAMQEQQALITDLTTRLAALEGAK
jgi:hypothetical protein